jgi:hypothetical protein
MNLDKTLKCAKEFPDFCAEVESLTTEEINARLAQFAKDSVANDEAKEADEDLAAAKANATEFSAPYRDARKAIRMKSDFLVTLLNARQVLP